MSLKNASIIYRMESGEGRRVWSGVSLDIHRGEWIAVVGPNGSGKSTLASVLLGLNPLSEGLILRSPDEGTSMTRGVLQLPEAQFIGETIAEELDFLPQSLQLSAEERMDWYANVLAAVGLTLSPERTMATLSGGQKQLVNLAAALAANPEILLLDEPTAMLDPASRLAVRAAVRLAHQRGTTIVWISHRLEEATDATRVIGFGDGRITFDGEPRKFFYGEAEGAGKKVSPCVELGFDPPFAIQTAMHLLEQGLILDPLPLCMEELAEAISCR
ncbi:ATP-binding cassette domain-containing protein [Paenibacillus qinlingensis]|uniref:Energy-coupling factor transport system ATP-binding protein n=1 Tax=Paenibacillus qinlingensis TaxID=1837343 RepID=A0ABU1P1H5_9BACL|nr:ATP-binding cassette domain-containing protein [Paenibacillus qinlingensis]MDR6553409.1 energy-coupling factor transport system ATP-binding protein [Paenibacillus qinlingensis]